MDTAAFSTVCDDVSLGRRAELLEQMESRREQLKVQRKQQAEESEAARQRNNTLLQVGGDNIKYFQRAMELLIVLKPLHACSPPT